MSEEHTCEVDENTITDDRLREVASQILFTENKDVDCENVSPEAIAILRALLNEAEAGEPIREQLECLNRQFHEELKAKGPEYYARGFDILRAILKTTE